MKQVIYLFLISVLFITTSDITAQTTAFCKETKTETMSDEVCIDNDNRPGSKERAIEAFKAHMLDGYTCKTDRCPRPSKSKCGPEIISYSEPTLSNNEWCFDGDVEWKCSKCKPIKSDTAPADPDGEEGDWTDEDEIAPMQEGSYDLIEVEGQETLATIQTLAPNPSQGIVQLDVQIKEVSVEEVAVQVTDVSGKVIWSRKYSNISTPIFSTQLDLSQVSQGIYFTSIFVDQQLIGSSKLSIQ